MKLLFNLFSASPSMGDTTSIMVLGLTIIAIIVSVWTSSKKKSSYNITYPPYAPGRFPLVGHLPQFARGIPLQELLRQWSLQVGPVFTVQFGVKRWVILNSLDAVKQLIVDKSTIYSSRNLPDTLVNDLMDGGM